MKPIEPRSHGSDCEAFISQAKLQVFITHQQVKSSQVKSSQVTAGLRSTFDRLPYGCLLFMYRLDLTTHQHAKLSDSARYAMSTVRVNDMRYGKCTCTAAVQLAALSFPHFYRALERSPQGSPRLLSPVVGIDLAPSEPTVVRLAFARAPARRCRSCRRCARSARYAVRTLRLGGARLFSSAVLRL